MLTLIVYNDRYDGTVKFYLVNLPNSITDTEIELGAGTNHEIIQYLYDENGYFLPNVMQFPNVASVLNHAQKFEHEIMLTIC